MVVAIGAESFLQLVSLFFTPGAGEIDIVEGSFTVLCLGDSFTYGVGASSLEGSYPERLEKVLMDEFAANVVNEGVRGSNSSMIYRSFGAKIEKYEPKLVLLMTGINDSWNMKQRTPLQNHPEVESSLSAGAFDSILGWSKLYRLFIVVSNPPTALPNIEANSADESAEIVLSERKYGDDWGNFGSYDIRIRNEAKRLLESLAIADERKDSEAAAGIMGEIVKLRADSVGVWTHFAEVAHSANDIELAWSAIRTAYELNPGDLRMHENRALIATLRGDFDTASESIRIILSTPEITDGCRWIIANARRPEIDLTEMIEDYEISLEEKYPPELIAEVLGQKELGELTRSADVQVLEYNIVSMYKIALQKGASFYLLGYPSDTSDKLSLSKISKKWNIPYIDLSEPFASIGAIKIPFDSKYFIADGHPTDAGYQLIAETISERVFEKSD
ncbi:MAG: SGNH/GDSL hydrolase family protein [Planctomycetes bacterium]|nr:SGNH/GDSL hydrolase family protein [Planctomycetota bacterium]